MPYKTGLRLLGVARNPANGFPARLLAWYSMKTGLMATSWFLTWVFFFIIPQKMGVVYDSPEVENRQRFPDGAIFQSFFQSLPGW